ncbi:MAG TPA: DUF1641 domain-containing protein [Rhodothermales bacterium]|nr:DUF1641 domain-containing protein [Rhodothermales bacterium]
MAQPLEYVPPQVPGEAAFTAADDLARLVETLHTSGTLRVLNGFFGRLGAVSEVALDTINTPEGRNGLANLLVLAKALGRIDPQHLARFADAVDHGLDAAGRRLESPDDPPGTLATLRKLRDPDVRRGLDAVLTVLGTLGADLHGSSKDHLIS